MTSPQLSPGERELLTRIQSGFPLLHDPYAALASGLGDTADRVHASLLRLRRDGIVRRIGGSFAAGALGHLSTLVAARVVRDQLAAVAAVASAFPEVTHNYERDGEINLWFTVIAPGRERLGHILGCVRQAPGVLALHDLPAQRLFKIRVDFHLADSPAPASARPDDDAAVGPAPLELDTLDRRLICRACGDIGDARTPFASVAAAVGSTEADVLARLGRYRQAGALRRFGAVLRHRAAGVTANGMSVWNVPDADVPRVGDLLAARPEVSHCYQRPRFADWPYNLFAMIHGRDQAACLALAASLAAAAAVGDYRVLFSGREFKKTSMVYFPEALATAGR